MMPSTVVTCMDLVPRTSRMAAGPPTKVIHQRLPMVMFYHHHHQQHQPQRRANSLPQSAKLYRIMALADSTHLRNWAMC